MQNDVNIRWDNQVQDKISRVAEGVLMLSGAVIGIWLMGFIAVSYYLSY